MPLLMSFRRWWAAVFVAILLLPTLGLFTPDVPAPLRTVLEPEARWWEDAGKRLDPWVNNTFGFRGAVLAAHRSYVRFIGDTQGDLALRGEAGSLFLKDEHAVEQSLGQLVRPEAVAGLVAFATRMNAYMKAHGGRFVVLVPPNGHTTNFEYLPAYARRLKTAPTEYDLVAGAMAKAGITFVDMRPILAEAKKTGPVHWRYDTHWNQRGMLLGFNAAMAAAGRPDLEVAAQDALGPAEPRLTSDLLRVTGSRVPDPPDVQFPPKGPMVKPKNPVLIPGIMKEVPKTDPFVPYAIDTGHAGPRIMVIGDSFTQGSWQGLGTFRASAYAWMHHRYCRFDMEAVERFRPDILIYAPTERAMPCKGVPEGMPAQGAG
ncbi:alginate O-acetyltransferase AlgX-related protein [Xanthobacter sp. AM11]|uniref:alginate O-acetyltransferase AlgX-related protein n=1 Tax=Xanthobacter sp. AM11 TaxID=3380643 RepID=UPI0039BFCBB6